MNLIIILLIDVSKVKLTGKKIKRKTIKFLSFNKTFQIIDKKYK